MLENSSEQSKKKWRNECIEITHKSKICEVSGNLLSQLNVCFGNCENLQLKKNVRYRQIFRDRFPEKYSIFFQ